ncbi:hypothetical protein [Nocardia sp. NPDC046763]|uniref:hypothetical protein n=1 Tax=Nocardia sp. NPDC046763 TaxID=3155256 RepID=UPI0033D66484
MFDRLMRWRRGSVCALILLVPALPAVGGCASSSDTSWAVPPTAEPAAITPCTDAIQANDPSDRIVELIDLSADNKLTYSLVHLARTSTKQWRAACGPSLTAPLSDQVTITSYPQSEMCGVTVSPTDCTLAAMKTQANHWSSWGPIATIRITDGKVVSIRERTEN